MDYVPQPIETSGISLDDEVLELTELLARNAHDIWAQRRFADGWTYGRKRDDSKKEHPGLVPYEALSDSEKAYDRSVALQTLKAIMAMGYRIVKA